MAAPVETIVFHICPSPWTAPCSPFFFRSRAVPAPILGEWSELSFGQGHFKLSRHVCHCYAA
eukprot:6516647-Heterocapsa_arctica.AAC.1